MGLVRAINKPKDIGDLNIKESEKDGALAIAKFIAECEKENMSDCEKFMREHDITDFDMNVINELGNVRRPLILFRGKPITEEQVKVVITGEEPLFREEPDVNHYFDIRESRGILKNIFYRQGYTWLSTFLNTDGTVGGDLIFLGKYPMWDEIFEGYMELGEKYPFLDMVVCYTTYDEDTCGGCCGWDRGYAEAVKRCKCKDCMPYIDLLDKYNTVKHEYNPNPDFEELYFREWDTSHVRSDVKDFVVLTIWIHDGKTDVLFGEKAAAKFDEYNRLYCAPEYEFMFSSDLYNYENTCICNKEYVESLFEFVGRPRETCDEYIKKGFISPFNESATVVTKAWVTEQYNKYIRGSAKQNTED